jgi:hypothetical protein
MWQRDDPYHQPLDRAFLNSKTGEVIWMMVDERKDDQDTEEILDPAEDFLREKGKEPTEWEEVRPLHHGEHHEIFREFLATLPGHVSGQCNNASIGGFLGDLEKYFDPEDAARIGKDWNSFHEQALQRRAEEWLRERGVAVAWT